MFLPPPPASFEYRVEPSRGLTLVAGGVPLVRGSYFQVVSPDWKRSYYSSTYGGAQRIESVDADTVRLTFKGDDVDGTQTYHREGDRLKVHTEFAYRGSAPAIAEIAAGLVWIPAFARAATPAPSPTLPLDARRLMADNPTFGLDGPLGKLEGRASAPMTLFDARRYPQDWAEGKDAVWAGDLNLPLAPGKTTAFDLDWKVPTVTISPAKVLIQHPKAAAIPDARLPDETRPLLIPKPEQDHLDYDHPIDVTGGWSLPIGPFEHFDTFEAALARRFEVPLKGGKRVNLDGGISKLGLNPGGYRITLRSDRGVTVVGEEDTGLRNGVERLAQIAFARNGHLYLPSGYLYDQPQIPWRGVHLFGGPNARPFQKALWTRVLRPLGFDRVVLQCERTAWDATPGIATAETMTKPQLAELFGLYRNLGVEAIPLIQSFGHLEWLFANGKNLDLAMNPDVPYAIDPRKPRAKEVMGRIWDEAIDLAKPSTVHFGLDEVSMTGWTGGDAFLTDNWRLQLGFLGDLARQHDVTPMLWGDQALFGKEAPDAANAGTAADALERRAAVPKGSYVADWHYKDDPRPETYTGVLQLWKDARMNPIAAAWYRPDNIRGFALAANELGAGFLQTTWAGYASDEAAMLENPRQFSALVLAADYSWSGRKELPVALPYDPQEVFQHLFYGRPSPLTPRPGTAFGDGAPFRVGDIRFRALDLRTASVLRPNPGAGGTIDLALEGKGRELDLALATEVAPEEGATVAEVRIERVGLPPLVEPLVYGRDVRALSDPAYLSRGERTVPGGPCKIRIDLGKPGTAVTRVVIRPLDTYSGLRLMGATMVN